MKILVTDLTPDVVARVECLMDSLRPRVLPSGWHSFGEEFSNCGWWVSNDGLKVCVEVESHGAGGLWIHLSTSRTNRTPSYDDLARVKSLFIGDDRKAVQVFPAKREHYNLHQFCLHLWSPVDADPLPDLRRDDGGL